MEPFNRHFKKEGRAAMKGIIDIIHKNRKLAYLLIFLVVLVILAVMELYQKQAGDWVELKTRDFMGGVSFYDKNMVKNKADDPLRVRIKTVYTGEGRAFFVNFIVNYISRQSGNTLEGFSYVINTNEINCAEKKCKLLSTTLYDENDRVLYSRTYQKENWKDILPHTDMEDLEREICN